MRDRIRWDRILIWGAYVAILGSVSYCAFGCTRRVAAAPVHLVQPPVVNPAEETQSEKVHRLEGELSTARKDLSYEQNRWLRYIATWSAALCVLGAVVCAVGSFFLPVMKKRLLIGSAAFVAGLAVAVSLRQAIPYLPFIGLGVVGIGVVLTLPTFIKHAHLSKGG